VDLNGLIKFDFIYKRIIIYMNNMTEVDEGDIDEYGSDTEYDTGYDVLIDKDIDKSITNIEDIENFKKFYSKFKKSNMTKPVLNKYEMTRVLCERTSQIENGALPYITNVERFTDSYSIALEEFKLKRIPFIIRRPKPDLQGYEYWKLKDMLY